MAIARGAAGLARWGWQLGLDLLLPPGCMACDAAVAGPFQLCARCFGSWHFITAPFCAGCGVPFGYAGQGHAIAAGRCPGCILRPPAYASARGAIAYEAASRPLVLAFKHASRTELARLYAPMMVAAGRTMLAQAELLVPVPLHPSRLRQRGYNQAGLLAGAVGRIAGVRVLPDGLQRLRATVSLGRLAADARAAAMQGAVTVRATRGAAIAGRRIVLVDDVMTSGATANDCARALLAAGATRVDVLVAARVPDPDLDRSTAAPDESVRPAAAGATG